MTMRPLLVHSFLPYVLLAGLGLASTQLAACSDTPVTPQGEDKNPSKGDESEDDDEPTDGDEPSDDDEPADDESTMKKDAGKSSTTKLDAGKPDAGTASTKDAGKVQSDAGETPSEPEPSKGDAGSSKSDAAVVSTGDAGGEKPTSGELCHLKPYQVGVLGDSYIDLSGDFTKFVQENARKAGALGATENYIDLARSGAAMQKDNLVPAIPTQLPTLLSTSKRAGPEGPKLVLMTGGGNDVLIDAMACSTIKTPTEMCKTVVSKSLVVIKKLFADMAAGGIKEVVYFWYPDLGDQHGKVINDYSIPLAKEACESDTNVKCHFVDTRDGFRGHPEYVAFDGIHPTAAGSRVIADLVWDVMVENCLASK